MEKLADAKRERSEAESKYLEIEKQYNDLDYDLNKIYKSLRDTPWNDCKCRVQTLDIVEKSKKTYDKYCFKGRPANKIAEKLEENRRKANVIAN